MAVTIVTHERDGLEFSSRDIRLFVRDCMDVFGISLMAHKRYLMAPAGFDKHEYQKLRFISGGATALAQWCVLPRTEEGVW